MRRRSRQLLATSLRNTGRISREILLDIVGVPSESGQETAALRRLEQLLRHDRITVRRQRVGPRRWNLVATLGVKGGYRVLLCSHIDTVPADNQDVRVVGGTLWGRGACDAKGSVAAIVAAVRSLADSDVPLVGQVTLLVTVGEEFAGDGIETFVRSGRRPFDWAVVGEPTDLALGSSQSGYVEFDILARSPMSHAFDPRSAQATLAVVHSLTLLERRVAAITRRKGVLFVRWFQAGCSDNFWRVRPIAHSRALANGRNDAEIDKLRRLPPNVVREIRRLDIGTQIRIKIADWDYGVEAKRAAAATAHLARGAARVGIRLGRMHLPSWTDGATLASSGIPVVTFGPGKLRDAHTASERVRFADVASAARIIAAALLEQDREARRF